MTAVQRLSSACSTCGTSCRAREGLNHLHSCPCHTPVSCCLLLRRVAVMENVTALLSKSDGCRDIFNFILQARRQVDLCLRPLCAGVPEARPHPPLDFSQTDQFGSASQLPRQRKAPVVLRTCFEAGRSRTFLVAARPGDDALFQDFFLVASACCLRHS